MSFPSLLELRDLMDHHGTLHLGVQAGRHGKRQLRARTPQAVLGWAVIVPVTKPTLKGKLEGDCGRKCCALTGIPI